MSVKPQSRLERLREELEEEKRRYEQAGNRCYYAEQALAEAEIEAMRAEECRSNADRRVQEALVRLQQAETEEGA